MNDHDEPQDNTPPIDAYASGFVDGAAHVRSTGLDDAYQAGLRDGLAMSQQPEPSECPVDQQKLFAERATGDAASVLGRLVGNADPVGSLLHQLLADQVAAYHRAFTLMTAALDQAEGLDSQQLLVHLAATIDVFCTEIAAPTLRKLNSLHWSTRQTWGEPPGETQALDRFATEVAATLAFVQVNQDTMREVLQRTSINVMKDRDADGLPQEKL